MWILLLIRDILVMLVLFGAPGYLLCRACLGPLCRDEAAVLSIAAGTVAVSIASFSYALVSRTFLGPATIIAFSLTISVASIGVLFRRAGGASATIREIVRFEPSSGKGAPALLLGVAVFAFYLVNYDRAHFYYHCINQNVVYSIEPNAMLEEDIASVFEGICEEPIIEGERDEYGELLSIVCDGKDGPRKEMNLLFRRTTGQRFGTTALIAPHAALFRGVGFRMFFALVGFLLASFTFLLSERLLGRTVISLAVAAFASLNPEVIKIIILDENVMSFAVSTAGLYLLLRSPRGNFLALFMLGAAIGIRHINLGLIPAVAYYIWSSMDEKPSMRAARLASLLPALVLGILPCLMHHQVAYGTIFQHEHFVDEAFYYSPHFFLGKEFLHSGLLNFPFFHYIIRTPYNPFPMFLYWPIYIAAHLGLVACALMCMGLVWLIINERRLFWTLAIWIVPVLCLLAVIEDWVEPNKMGVCLTVFAGPTVLLVCGLRALLDSSRWKKNTLALVLLVGVLFALVKATAHVEFPPDPRYPPKYPQVRRERPEYLDHDRARFTKGNLFPDYSLAEDHASFEPGKRLSGLAVDFAHRDYLLDREHLPGEIAQDAAPVRLVLDLGTPLVGRTDFLRLEGSTTETGDVFVDLTVPEAEYMIEDIQVEWAEHSLDVMFFRKPGGVIKIFLRFGGMVVHDYDMHHPRFGMQPAPHPDLRVEPGRSALIPFVVSSRMRLRLVEMVDAEQSLYFVWHVLLDDGELSVGRSHKHFHN